MSHTGLSLTWKRCTWQLMLSAFTAVGVLAAAVAPEARAQAGSSSVLFLMIEPDSRSAGMGNAGVALADNANAIFWNPAGLASQRGTEAGITHSNWLADLNANLFYEYLVAKHHVRDIGTFGAHVTYLHLGENSHRNELGDEIDTFKSYDLSAGLSYGRQLTEHFSLGGGARLIYSDLADAVVNGQQTQPGVSFGLDLAALYRTDTFDLAGTDAVFSAGANLANMGPSIQYVESERSNGGSHADPIPTNIRFGYAFTFDFDEYNTLTLANDFSKLLVDRDSAGVRPVYEAIFTSWRPVDVQMNSKTDEPTRVGIMEQLVTGIGAEYWYDELFALRTGYFYEHPDNGARKFLTFGAGLRYNIVGIDFSYLYALADNHPLANTMRFSLLLDFAR